MSPPGPQTTGGHPGSVDTALPGWPGAAQSGTPTPHSPTPSLPSLREPGSEFPDVGPRPTHSPATSLDSPRTGSAVTLAMPLVCGSPLPRWPQGSAGPFWGAFLTPPRPPASLPHGDSTLPPHRAPSTTDASPSYVHPALCLALEELGCPYVVQPPPRCTDSRRRLGSGGRASLPPLVACDPVPTDMPEAPPCAGTASGTSARLSPVRLAARQPHSSGPVGGHPAPPIAPAGQLVLRAREGWMQPECA